MVRFLLLGMPQHINHLGSNNSLFYAYPEDRVFFNKKSFAEVLKINPLFATRKDALMDLNHIVLNVVE